MDLQLTGKKAFVSGSTKGLGLAMAEALAKEGARVVINGRDQAAVATATRKIAASAPGCTVEGFPGNITLAEEAKKLKETHPSFDILVNNVGIFEAPTAFEDISDEDWRRFFEINFLSAARLARLYLPGMKRNNWGRLVFISSESAVQIPADMVHYGATKTALLGLSRGIAESCAGTGVTSNAILPGPTRTDGVERFKASFAGNLSFDQFEADFFRDARPSSLIKRFARPEEVANLVAYVCSPLSSATTGAALRVDGGVVRACF